MQERLNILIFRGVSGQFVALCLDFDFATQASTQEGAVLAFEEAYRSRCLIAKSRGEVPFQNCRRSPQEYWERFERAIPVPHAGEAVARFRAA